MLRASRSPFIASFIRSFAFINMTRLIKVTRSARTSPISIRSYSTTRLKLAACSSGVSAASSSHRSEGSQDVSTSASETSMCSAINQASSTLKSSVSSALSKNSAAALWPLARSSWAICCAPRSFSKNSRLVSRARRSVSAERAGFARIASMIPGNRTSVATGRKSRSAEYGSLS